MQVTTHRELVRDGGGGSVDVAALPQHPSTLVQQLQQVFHVQHLQQAPPTLVNCATYKLSVRLSSCTSTDAVTIKPCPPLQGEYRRYLLGFESLQEGKDGILGDGEGHVRALVGAGHADAVWVDAVHQLLVLGFHLV